MATNRELIESIVSVIVKEYGKGSAMVLSSGTSDSDVTSYISTQSSLLNAAIGHPGVPVGRLTTIVGKVGGGKTTIATHLLADTQKRGGIGILFDTEHTYDAARAATIGVNPDELIILQPDCVEDVLGQMESLINVVRKQQSDSLVTIIWDSVAGTPTRSEIEGDVGDVTPAIHARTISRGLRKLTGLVAREKIALIFVNQQKTAIGFGYGPKTSMIAEAPISFHSTLILDIARIGMVGKQGADPTGIKCRAKVTKNKLAPPFREAIFNILFDSGIDEQGAKLDIAVELGLVARKGAWYVYGERKFQQKNWGEILSEFPEIERRILESSSNIAGTKYSGVPFGEDGESESVRASDSESD